MRQFTAYIRAQAAFKLFMFDGTLCIFGGAFRQFASRFQMTRTIIWNNHCTQTLFPRVGKMDFCPTRFQTGRLCSGLTIFWWCLCRCAPLTCPSLAIPPFVRRVMCPKSCFVIRITEVMNINTNVRKRMFLYVANIAVIKFSTWQNIPFGFFHKIWERFMEDKECHLLRIFKLKTFGICPF